MSATKKHIGGLRRKIALETSADMADEAGGFDRSWQTVAWVWAQIEPVRGEAIFVAAGAETALTHRIRIRWRPDVDGGVRFRLGPRVFVVLSAVDADASRRYMICRCREYAA